MWQLMATAGAECIQCTWHTATRKSLRYSSTKQFHQ